MTKGGTPNFGEVMSPKNVVNTFKNSFDFCSFFQNAILGKTRLEKTFKELSRIKVKIEKNYTLILFV